MLSKPAFGKMFMMSFNKLNEQCVLPMLTKHGAKWTNGVSQKIWRVLYTERLPIGHSILLIPNRPQRSGGRKPT